jgi:glycosyltransferase involved in cell wall biosynthesis
VYKISVVIPTLNRAAVLASTLDYIERQTVSRDIYEVLVIDNDSSDETQAVLQAKAAAYSNLRPFSQPKRGAAATRNMGIQEAVGDIVLFIDDDIFVEPNLVEQHLEYHRKNPKSSIIGEVVSPWEHVTDPFLRYLRDRKIFNPYSLARGPMDFSYYHTGNVSTHRALLNQAGRFNEEFFFYGMEDIELGYRLEKKFGCRMVSGPAAKAFHQYFPTYEYFIERCQQAGYSLGKLVDLHPELKDRFIENGKRTRFLKRFHKLYRVFCKACRPVYGLVKRWEEKRGHGPITEILDQYYFWAVRYHFFLGYSQYMQYTGRAAHSVLVGRERIPTFAIERHD